MQALTLGEIAGAIGATLEGESAARVERMAALDEAGPGDLCYADSAKRAEQVHASRAAACIVGADFPASPGVNLLRLADPRLGLFRALELFRPDRRLAGIHPSAVVAADAVLGEGVGAGPCAVIEAGAVVGAGSQVRAGAYVGPGVRIGRHCDIGVNAVLLDGSVLGDRCILHPGVVLGSDGYGYHWTGDHHHKIPQIGGVVLEDDVELGANTCIDRATMGETRIGRGSKFDNLVHIAHNNRIGAHVLLTGQVGIAGSSRIGDGVVAGGQAGIADHLTIGAGVQIGAQAGVIGDIEAGARVWGTPARPMQRVLREQAALGRLPQTLRDLARQREELAELRDRIARLEAHLGEAG
jgi:UDP-3-O-[3-hydroxymyristoyl] glucosamine N-acyltransferase